PGKSSTNRVAACAWSPCPAPACSTSRTPSTARPCCRWKWVRASPSRRPTQTIGTSTLVWTAASSACTPTVSQRRPGSCSRPSALPWTMAVRELADQPSVGDLPRFGSPRGPFPGAVRVDGACLHINGHCVKVLCASTPEAVDWAALDIDLLRECSGQYTRRDEGARFVE